MTRKSPSNVSPLFGMSRRGFITTASASAMPLILPRAGMAAPKTDADVIKIGLIGCGGRGTGAALQALNAENGTVVLTAMADTFPDKIESKLAVLKQALGEEGQDRVQVSDANRFVGFNAFQQLIDSDVDVVLLATPPHFRPMMLEAAVAAGKHIFCEKPMAVDGPGVRRVLAAAAQAKEKGLNLVSGFCWRYHHKYRELYKEIHNGALGDLRAVYSTYLAAPVQYKPYQEPWSEMEWHIRNWQATDWLSGDHVVEQAIHSLDKMAWAMQDVAPLSVTAIGGRQAREGVESGNIYDHFSATFEYPGDVKGFHMARQMYGCSNDNSDWVYGEKGVATIHPWGGIFEINTGGEEPWSAEDVPCDMYQQEHDELFASIRAGGVMNDGVWMAHSTLLGIMTRMSAYSGQTVSFEQALNSQEVLGPQEYSWGAAPLSAPPIPGKHKFI
ncbi:MAG: myo-inositol 2-dehydrogenase/D-chiro-inositol 1-dehydrogenase [Planctomycetota bacterium]|jgi:myo-inositol 2-dehydrogenase/D-chiro-inositol 1-dehydrogenase